LAEAQVNYSDNFLICIFISFPIVLFQARVKAKQRRKSAEVANAAMSLIPTPVDIWMMPTPEQQEESDRISKGAPDPSLVFCSLEVLTE